MFFFKGRKAKASARDAAPPKKEFVPLEVANLQGMGARGDQQDAFGLSRLCDYSKDGFLAVLCDGMGGMAEGKAIAERVVSEVCGEFNAEGEPGSDWPERLNAINDGIYADYRGIGGSTLIAAYIRAGSMRFWCAGDSDLCLLRGGRMYSMNRRHEYINELFCRVLGGECSLSAALSNSQGGALTQYIGNKTLQMDYTRLPFTLQAGDVIMLCSDGVSDTLDKDALTAALMLEPAACVETIEKGITDAALREQDNYTAIIIKYNGEKEESQQDG